MGKTRRVDEDEYTRLTGRKPPVDDSEDAWQWDYRGTKAERDELAERLGLEPDPDVPATQDESLF